MPLKQARATEPCHLQSPQKKSYLAEKCGFFGAKLAFSALNLLLLR
jgi:hypothetical protein